MTAAPYQQHIKQPTLSGTNGLETLRREVAWGVGLSAMCCDCHTSTRRTAAELLERFWRSADVLIKDLIVHFRCAGCGGHRLVVSTYQSAWLDSGHKQAAFVAMQEAKVTARLLELAYEDSDRRRTPPGRGEVKRAPLSV